MLPARGGMMCPVLLAEALSPTIDVEQVNCPVSASSLFTEDQGGGQMLANELKEQRSYYFSPALSN